MLQNAQTQARQGIAFQPRMSTDSLYALHSATRLGLGVAVGSAWIFADDIASGRLLHLLPQWQADPLPIYLVYPHARFYPAKLRLFVEAMRQAIPTPGMVGSPGPLRRERGERTRRA
ncbi:LysR substrate binding domain protein [compost metagenome]